MDISHSKRNAKRKGNSKSDGEKNKELIIRNRIDGTPFGTVWTEQTKWFGVVGKYRVTEYEETEEEVIQKINEKNWDIIMAVMNIVVLEGGKKYGETTVK